MASLEDILRDQNHTISTIHFPELIDESLHGPKARCFLDLNHYGLKPFAGQILVGTEQAFLHSLVEAASIHENEGRGRDLLTCLFHVFQSNPHLVSCVARSFHVVDPLATREPTNHHTGTASV